MSSREEGRAVLRQRGLAVRVTAGCGKSYLAQYTFAGSKRRVPLGPCSGISLAAAREAVQAIRGDVAKGRDPAAARKAAATEAERKAAEEALTLDALLTQWAASHFLRRRGRPRAALCLQGPTGKACRRTQRQDRGAHSGRLRERW
jgi:hypothetical protein